MGIVTDQMIEESKEIEVKVVDKDLYENARAVMEIHKLRTGVKPKWTPMDTVRLSKYLESRKEIED